MSGLRFQKFLSISEGFPYLDMPDGTEHCSDLNELPSTANTVQFIDPYEGVERLPRLRRLRYLSLYDFEKKWLTHFEASSSLQILQLSHLVHETLPSFNKLIRLRVLILFRCHYLNSLRFLRGIKNLHSLCISECLELESLTALSAVESLRELWIDGAGRKAQKIKSLKPLQKLERLQYLQLMVQLDKKEKNPLRPLASLPDLQELVLADRYSPAEYDYLLESCPKLKRIRFPMKKQWPPKNK